MRFTHPTPHNRSKYTLTFLTSILALALLLATLANHSPAAAQTPANPDKAALVALYNATVGDDWVDKDNWLSDEPLSEWRGVTTNDDGRVTHLHLWSNNLVGTIPAELGNLSELTSLALQDNQLTGGMPSELSTLSKLEHLGLWGNQLSGTLPSWLGSLSNLKEIWLSGNQLTGEIPSSLGNLSSLEELNLRNNNLTGTIPSELGNLSNLKELRLRGNQLTGAIPPELGNLSNLEILWLSFNDLEGEIPSDLSKLTNLRRLLLSNDGLTGEIPAWLGDMPNLTGIYLGGNSLTGEIPAGLGNLSLTNLELHDNQLTGEVPTELGSLSTLWVLSLHDNNLTGQLPQSLTNLPLVTLTFGDNAGLCAPTDEAFQSWMAGIANEYIPDGGAALGPNCFADSCVLTIGIPRTVNGAWTEECVAAADKAPNAGEGDRYARFYAFTVSEQSEVSIALTSEQDTYLYLRKGAGKDGEIAAHHDDIDYPNNTNSSLTETLEPGDYTIEATTYFTQRAGDFTLAVEVSSTAPPPAAPCVASIGVPANISGAWASDCVAAADKASNAGEGDRYARFYTFIVSEQSEVSIALTSEQDTYLYLRKGAGKEGEITAEHDDIDYPNNTNSSLTETLEPGDYTIEATTYYTQKAGAFTLKVKIGAMADAMSPTSSANPAKALTHQAPSSQKD